MDAMNNFKYPLFLLPHLLNLGKDNLTPMNLPVNGDSVSVVIGGLDPDFRQASTATGDKMITTPPLTLPLEPGSFSFMLCMTNI